MLALKTVIPCFYNSVVFILLFHMLNNSVLEEQ